MGAINRTIDDNVAKTLPWQHDFLSHSRADLGLGSGSSGGGPGELDPVVRRFTNWDPKSTFDVARDFYKMVTQPAQTGTEAYQAGKIEGLQDQFRRDRAGELSHMSQDIARVMTALRDLGQHLIDHGADAEGQVDRANQLVDQKAKMGDDLMAGIDDRIANAQTPEEAQRLQAMKDDLARWMQDRDQRVAADRQELAELQKRAGPLDTLSFYGPKLQDAATDLLSPGLTDPTRFGSAVAIGAIRNGLFGYHRAFDSALNGKSFR